MENDPGRYEESGRDSRDRQIKQRADEYSRNLEQASWRQAELHMTAAGFWGNFQWAFGGAAAVLAAVASGTAFSHYPSAAGVLALCSAGSAALVTALRPGDISAQHLKSACLVVGKSTVPVGTARRLMGWMRSAAPAGKQVDLAWNPEFLREGFAVQDTLRPDRFVFGAKVADLAN